MKIFLLLIFLFCFSTNLWSKSRKSNCSLRERKIKDCHLSVEKYKIHFNQDKIFIDDGFWKGLEDLPIKGNATEWKKIYFLKLGKRKFLEFLIWKEEEEEIHLENLYWVVGELKGHQFKKHFQHIVQKRHKKVGKEKKEAIIYDKMDKFKVYFSRGRVMWNWKHHSGVLE